MMSGDRRRGRGLFNFPGAGARTRHTPVMKLFCRPAPSSHRRYLNCPGLAIRPCWRAHGIGITAARKGVGEHLADHYISRLSWRLSSPLSINHHTRGIGLVGAVLQYALTRRGVLSMPAGMLAGFVRSRPGLAGPDIQYHIANASFANPEKRVFDSFPGMTFGPCQLRPESRGSVHITSANPLAAPEIRPKLSCH